MVNRATQGQPLEPASAGLGLFHPLSHESKIARWRINGFPAKIIIWTVEEWESLPVRPDDAQYYPCGVWCALRMD
jgi:hypothetical protein